MSNNVAPPDSKMQVQKQLVRHGAYQKVEDFFF